MPFIPTAVSTESMVSSIISALSDIISTLESFPKLAINDIKFPTSFIISDKTYEDQLHVIAELPYVSGKNEDIKLLIFDKNGA